MIDIKAYLPGTYVEIQGIYTESGKLHRTWQIVSTTVKLTVSWTNGLEPLQVITILPIDADTAEPVEFETIDVNTDLFDIVEV